MLWELDDLIRVTQAEKLRWPAGAGPAVRATQDLSAVGPQSLFFPMSWKSVEVLLFRQLQGAGAAGVVIYSGQEPPPEPGFPDLGVLSLPSPLEGYLRLAAAARRRAKPVVIGITGSSGKSSTKEYLASICRRAYRVSATRDSHNLITDCADLFLDLRGTGDEAVVVEMGFGWRGDIARMASLARPFGGIITKVTPDHLDGAGGSLQVLAQEKGMLGLHLPPDGFFALSADDPGSSLISRSGVRSRVVTFGGGPHADAGYEGVQMDEGGTTFRLRLFGESTPCHLRTFGEVQAANAAAAALAGRLLGFSLEDVVTALEQTSPLHRRFAVHRYSHGLVVIDDTFSASIDAIMNGLRAATTLAGGRRLVAVISGVAQLGVGSVSYHRALGSWLAGIVGTGGELVLVVADERCDAVRAGALEAGFPAERIHLVERIVDLPAQLLALTLPDTVLYCKTSQFYWTGPQIDVYRESLPARGFVPLAERVW